MNNNARLYLFPVPLSDNPVTEVLPAHNIELIKTVKY